MNDATCKRLLAAALVGSMLMLSGCQWLRPAAPGRAAQPPAAAASSAASGSKSAAAARLLAEGWRCEDGSILGTRFVEQGRLLELRIDAGLQRLPEVRSASGARFENEQWLFWNRGAQALLQRKPKPPVYCAEVRSLSLIEDARARGVTLRSRGNDPGWLLEIGPGNRVLLDEQPGPRRSIWPDLAPAPGPVPASSRYQAESAGRSYRITVLPDACVDELSGERFTLSVVLEVDGRRLRGCATRIGD